MARKTDEGTMIQAVQCAEDLLNLSPEEGKEVAECYQNADSLSILVTGKTGTGKSTLVDGLLGFNIEADSGKRLMPCTPQVEEYKTVVNGIRLCLWDTPGLQDGTANQDEYLRQMAAHCSERDLTLYCIKCGGETRFVNGDDNPDAVAMKKLTRKFGMGFWSNTVIVLTFANWVSSMDRNWSKYSEEKQKQVFQSRIQEWKRRIQQILSNELQVYNVPIMVAGLPREEHLPDTKYWLSTFLHDCVKACKGDNARAALLKINESRITCDMDDMNPRSIKLPVLIGAGEIKTGAVVGGACGIAAFAKAGGVGMAVGGVVGAVVGVLAVFALAYFMDGKGKDKVD